LGRLAQWNEGLESKRKVNQTKPKDKTMFHSQDYIDRCRQAERHLDYIDEEPEDAFLEDRTEDYLLDREEQE
jgi:hypothetical protein